MIEARTVMLILSKEVRERGETPGFCSSLLSSPDCP